MQILEKLAKLCAILAGLLLTVITLMTCVSVIGRNTTGWTIQGDVELTGFVAGAAIALFLPWCQFKRGNIIVDFFTAKTSPQTQERLDRLGALLLAVAVGFLAWRTTLGGLSAWTSNSSSMMRGLPEWMVYVGMVPPLFLTALIALAQAIRGFPAAEQEGAL
jgi:TRAP-type C4-dicarboxylate transport system permease small subunit